MEQGRSTERWQSLRLRPIRPEDQATMGLLFQRVAEAVLRLSQRVEEHPQIAEVDINPFWVGVGEPRVCWKEVRARVLPLSPWNAFILRHLDD